MKNKIICNGDCFNCKYDDCINDKWIEAEAKKIEYMINYRETHEAYRKHQAEHKKEIYAKRKAAGLCVKCGKLPAKYGVFCYECKLYMRKYDRRKIKQREKRGREFWASNGKCFFCGEPVINGKKVCERHYELCCKSAEVGRNCENAKAYRERMRNHTFI